MANHRNISPVLLTVVGLLPMGIYLACWGLKLGRVEALSWEMEWGLMMAAVLLHVGLSAKWGNPGYAISGIYMLLGMFIFLDLIILALTGKMLLWVLFAVLCFPIVPMWTLIFWGPNAKKSFQRNEKPFRLTVTASIFTFLMIALGVFLAFRETPPERDRGMLMSWDRDFPLAGLALAGHTMGFMVFFFIQLNGISLSRWWSKQNKTPEELRPILMGRVERRASHPVPQALKHLAHFREGLPRNAIFLSTKSENLRQEVFTAIEKAEKRLLDGLPQTPAGEQYLICRKCVRRAVEIQCGAYTLRQCPNCSDYQQLWPGIREIHAVLGKIKEGETRAHSLLVSVWETDRKSVKTLDFEVLRISEALPGEDLDFAVNALITNWMDRHKPKDPRPRLELKGKPRLSENTLRMLRDFVANPGELDKILS